MPHDQSTNDFDALRSEPPERRHDGYHSLVDAVTAQGLRVAELSGRIAELSETIQRQHDDTRQDVNTLHEKINRHAAECMLEPRVKRLELVRASKTGACAVVVALGGIIAAAAWAVIKEPAQAWLLMRFGGQK